MKRIIDLTLTLKNDMRGVDIQQARTLEDGGWNAKHLGLYSHCGTHMDAPRHFISDGSTIDMVDLSTCIGRAYVIDLTPTEPSELITVQHLGSIADSISSGDRLLLRTDWYHRHGTPEYRDALPRISPNLAKWLVTKGVSLLGVEPPSVADVHNLEELITVHQVLLEGGVVIVEGLAHLDHIESDSVELTVLPLKVFEGDGAPVRALAVER